MKRDPRRTLLLRLRRSIRVSSTFDVRHVGTVEEQVCRTCGYVDRVDHGTALPAKMASYRAGLGVWGVCPGCSKIEADRRYPLST